MKMTFFYSNLAMIIRKIISKNPFGAFTHFGDLTYLDDIFLRKVGTGSVLIVGSQVLPSLGCSVS